MTDKEPSSIDTQEAFELMAAATRTLLLVEDEHEAIEDVLQLIVSHSGADRAYLLKNFLDAELRPYCRLVAEWHSPMLKPQSDHQFLEHLHHDDPKVSWVFASLKEGKSITGHFMDFPVEARELLQNHQVQSMMIQPLIIKNEWWGFIGLDWCFKRGSFPSELPILLKGVGTSLATYYDKYRLNHEVRVQREFFKTILENSNEGISVLDANGRITYQSPSNPQVLGYSNEVMMEKDYLSLIHPNDLPRAQQIYQEVFSTPDIRRKTTVSYLHAAGHYMKLEMEVINLLHQPAIKGVVVNFRDISETEAFKEKLQRSERVLQIAQPMAKIGSYEIDLKNGYTEVSDQLYHIHGINRRDVPDESKYFEHLLALVHPEDLENVATASEDGILSGKGYDLECRIITPAGELRYLNSTGEPVFDENRNIVKVVGTSQDITERKRRELEIEAISEKLRQKNAAFEHFAYVASHDLRAPVASLLGLTSLLDVEKCTTENAEVLAKFQPLLNQLDLTLVDIITSINSINNETLPGQLLEIDLQKTFDQVELQLYEDITKSEIVVKTDFTRCPSITYYRAHIHNLMLNLLSNAVKYRKRDVLAEVHIKSTSQDGFAILEFKDNGIGMDLATHGEKLFKMYQRLHDGNCIPGSGLGLYLVKQQVDQLGGKIEVSSTPGAGSTFTVYLKDQAFLKKDKIQP